VIEVWKDPKGDHIRVQYDEDDIVQVDGGDAHVVEVHDVPSDWITMISAEPLVGLVDLWEARAEEIESNSAEGFRMTAAMLRTCVAELTQAMHTPQVPDDS
jgi:hypothetical protein